MTAPVRIQLQRTARFNLQRASMARNGLPARKVDRTTRWGNPFKVLKVDGHWAVAFESTAFSHHASRERALHEAVLRFSAEVMPLLDLEPLQGHNLACWCPAGLPCHANALLDYLKG